MKWIFIYGPGRSGSTYLLRLIREVADCSVSDWGLGSILRPLLNTVGGIDKERFLNDLRSNLLESSKRNDNGQLDIVIKSASGNAEEFECYKKMFGNPLMLIFTIREPSGYMASALKKFPHLSMEELRQSYLQMFEVYAEVGGQIFDYLPNSKLEDYLSFLKILDFRNVEVEPFVYRGSKADDLITQEMSEAYEAFLRDNSENLFKS